MFFVLSTVSILGTRRQMTRFIIPPLSIADVPLHVDPTVVVVAVIPLQFSNVTTAPFYQQRSVTRYVIA